jgi:hypothetical protein
MSTEKPSLAELVTKAEGIATDLPKHREYGEALAWAVGVVNDREDLQKWLLWTYSGVGCGEAGDPAPPTDDHDLHACFCAISAIICDLSPGRNGIKSFPYRDWGRQIRDVLRRDPTHRARAMGAWNEAKSTIRSQIAQTGVGKPREAETQALRDRFEFGRGQVLFDGKDLELPSGDPLTMLEKLVNDFGRVVPYTDFDEHYSSATPGTVHKSKHMVAHSLATHAVPCKIKSKQGEGYFISESTPTSGRKKRVRK